MVIDAAMRVARQEGLQALSMRRLAEELGVSTMAAYRHVAGKEALVEDVLEATVASIPLDTDGETWDEQVTELVLRSYRVFLSVPGLADRLRGQALSRPGIIRWLEALNDPLITAGVPYRYRVGFSSALLWFLTGATRLDAAWAETISALDEVLPDAPVEDAQAIGGGQSLERMRAEDFLRNNLGLLVRGLDAAVAAS